VIKKVIVGILLLLTASLWFLILSPYDITAGIGESMGPTLKSGDLLIIKSPEETIKPGTIIVYNVGDEKVIHRVVEVNGETLKTKGDGNSWIDPWQVSISDVKGVYLFRIPYLGSVALINKNCWMK